MKTTTERSYLNGWRAIVSAIVVTLVIAAGLVSGVPLQAQAVPSGTWSALSAMGGKIPYSHAYRSSGGTTGYCGFSSKTGPAWYGDNVNYDGGVYVAPDATSRLSNGYRFGGENYYNASYAMNRFGATTDSNQASAVDYLMWSFSNRATSAEYVNKTIGGTSASFISYVQGIEARVKRESGPYTVHGAIKHNGTTVTLSNLGLKSRSGNWMVNGPQGLPSAMLKLTLTNAKHPTSGQTTFSYYPTGNAELKTFTVLDPTKPVSIAIVATGLPHLGIFVANPDNSMYQPLIIPKVEPQAISLSVSDAPDINTPTVVTNSSQANQLPNQGGYQARDQISITGGTPNVNANVKADLYFAGVDVPAQSAAIPLGAVKVQSTNKTVALNGTGTASVWTDLLTLPVDAAVGHYTWVVSVSGTNMKTVVTPFGVPLETFKIDPVKTEISLSTVSVNRAGERAQEVAPGTKVSDLLKVTAPANVLEGIPAKVTSTLYGPFVEKPSGSIAPDAPIAFQTETIISKAGEFATGASPSLSASGYYVWGYSYPDGLDAAKNLAYKGADNRLVFQDEITFVPWQPVVETEAFVSALIAGHSNGDSLSVSGGKPGATYQATVQAWGPLAEPPTQTNDVPAGTPLSAATEVTVTADNNGTASIDTDGVIYESAGWYTFTVELAATAESAAFRSPFGVPSETFSVLSVSTLATPDTLIGQPFTDTAILDGFAPEGSSIEFELWRESDGADASQDVLVLTTERSAVTGSGQFLSPQVSVDTAGRHYFREKLYLPGAQEPSHYGEPRLPGETVRVHQLYSNATVATAPGMAFRDALFVGGDVPETAHVVFDVFRQGSSTDGTDDVKILTSEKIYLWGNGFTASGGASWEPSETDPGVNPAPCLDPASADPACTLSTEVVVTPIPPHLLLAECNAGLSSVELPNTVGTTYKSIQLSTPAQIRVVATAADGFVFSESAVSQWDFDLTQTKDCTEIPPEPQIPASATEPPLLHDLETGPAAQSVDLGDVEGALNIQPFVGTFDSLVRRDESAGPGVEQDQRPVLSEFTVFSPVLSVEEPSMYYTVARYYLAEGQSFWQDSPRVAAESTRISAVTTKATESAVVGTEIFDQAEIVGPTPEGAYLTFQAFHSGAETDPVKFGATNPKPVYASEKVAVTGPGTYTSNGGSKYFPDQAGNVFWRYSLHQADGELISQGAIGDAGETSTITPPVPTGKLPKTGGVGIMLLLIAAATGTVGYLLIRKRNRA